MSERREREREREKEEVKACDITSASDLDTICWNRLVRPLLLDSNTCATLSKTASATTMEQYVKRDDVELNTVFTWVNTFLNSSWGWFRLSIDMVGEKTGEDIVFGMKWSDCVWLQELSVHLLQVSTETKCNPSFF